MYKKKMKNIKRSEKKNVNLNVKRLIGIRVKYNYVMFVNKEEERKKSGILFLLDMLMILK